MKSVPSVRGPRACIFALVAAVAPASAQAMGGAITTIGAPPGFAELEQPRELLVDVYFGDRRLGEAWVIARPGFVKLRDPHHVLVLIPNLKTSPAIAARLASELPDNAGRACARGNAQDCAAPEPQFIDVVFNEDRFRLDLYVNPAILDVARERDPYLPVPTAPLSLTSAIGGAIAGSTGGSPTYNFQNRTIVGFRNARIRSDSAFASDIGFIVDDLVAEVDTRRHRYSAGLFWAPGVDFTGRRRIAGIGFSTQFDTRSDADSLEATPLILFLGQPARVEVLVDGRLVSSSSYEAGNRAIDSSTLPSGSYPLVLRIREPGGNVREERRFFVKNAAIAPVGEPVYFAFAGLLANTRQNSPISVSKNVYYQIGAARRLSDSLALDAAILGTEQKPLAQLGAWLITDLARVRAAALASAEGDAGVLLQLGSSGTGRLNFNFDLRRVWSRSGEPLIPLPTYVDNFGSAPPTGAQIASGSYTQATGSVSLALGEAFLSLTGSYRRDHGLKSDYSIGPSLTWPVLNSGGFQLVVTADAQRSRSTSAAFAGFRILYTAGGYSTLATTGYASLRDRNGGRRSSRQVGSMSAQWFHQDEDRTQVALEAALQRDVESTTARANGQLVSQLGSARAEVLHGLEGRGGSQYGLTFQTGLAMGADSLSLGARDLDQSAVIVALGGSARDAAFDILIDEVPRGRIGAGSRVPVFLEAYRSYRLRLRPVSAAPVNYDSEPKTVTLFPGNVEQLSWTAERLVTIFGQAVSADGEPLANAAITLSRGIGQTDDNGYFQVDAAANDVLEFNISEDRTCKVPLAGIKTDGDFARLGKVVCR
jgi:hypothetical protein